MPTKKKKPASRVNAEEAAALQQATLKAVASFDPVVRMALAEKITGAHCPKNFAASIVEALDEPFEREQICFELNSIQGPWAESESKHGLRWLKMVSSDLEGLETGDDFMSKVFAHLVPV